MGRHNGSDPTVFMRALRPHTYEGRPYDEGDIYLAHDDLVETIETLKFAVRETPPPQAIRPAVVAATPVETPVAEQSGELTEATHVTETTDDIPDQHPDTVTETTEPAPKSYRKRR